MTVPAENETAARLLSGRAWEDFCDTLKQAGRVIERCGEDINDLDRAEWYRFLSRLVRHGCHRFIENAEPERPRLLDTPWRQGINFQSPDQDHWIAEFLDGQHDYRITGNLGSIPYFVMASFMLPIPANVGAREWAQRGIEGLEEFNPCMMRTSAFLASDAIHFDDKGNFTVIASQTKPHYPCDWLPIGSECAGILVRTLYHLREETIAPTMRIERLDSAVPRPIRAAEMSVALAKSAQIVLGYAELVRSWYQDNLGKCPNRIRFSRALYLANGGVADRHHGFGTWECNPDEALVLSFTPTPCDYWILQLCNIWQENLDNYEEGNGYLQKYRATYEPDGSVRVIVASENPNIGGNWIDPFGHVHGGWSLRLIKTQGDPPHVVLQRVKLAMLKQYGWSALDGVEPIMTGELAD